MKKYKVEFIESTKYIIDVLANDQQEATDLAQLQLIQLSSDGMLHYHETGSDTETGNVYDVTDTDDSFDALNK